MNQPPIYLDHSATTPLAPQVLEAMLPYWTSFYGNPSSLHAQGRAAARGLEQARRMLAELLNARPDEIVFTGCGSESDNLAIRGAMWAARHSGRGQHMITSMVEHEAVLTTCRQLAAQFDFDLTVLPVDEYGLINLAELEAAIRPDTVLISLMAANNEIGTVQPILEAGAIARAHGVLFHTDAIQAAAYQTWDMAAMPIDLLSLAPHKFYGPKGVGVLYVRQGIELESSLTGGGQEAGRRAGTVNVPFAVGAAAAFELAMSQRETDVVHCLGLRDALIAGILSAFPADCRLTGHPTQRLPHHASFAFRGITGNDLLIHLDVAGICASSGSACATGNPEPAHILQAIGLSDEWTKGGLRLTVGRQNSASDVAYVLQTLPEIVRQIHRFSFPLKQPA